MASTPKKHPFFTNFKQSTSRAVPAEDIKINLTNGTTISIPQGGLSPTKVGQVMSTSAQEDPPPLPTSTTPSFQIQFNIVSDSLPPNYGIRDCGGKGDCGPRVMSYLLFGTVGRQKELRDLVRAVYADENLLAKVMSTHPSMCEGKTLLPDWQEARMKDHNEKNPGEPVLTWGTFADAIGTLGVYFMDAEIWVLGRLFRTEVSIHMAGWRRAQLHAPGNNAFARVEEFKFDMALPDVLPEALAASALCLGFTLPQDIAPRPLRIFTLNDYHFMAVVHFGGRAARSDPLVVWPADLRGQLWTCVRVRRESSGSSLTAEIDPSRIKIDKLGRPHILLPRFGPLTLALRSIKHNGVNIATHASDLAKIIESICDTYSNVTGICLCGDGCTDLNGTRVVNMMVWFITLRPVMIKRGLALLTMSQYWADDSPSNLIEHMWNFGCKHLIGLVCPACFEVLL